MKKKIIILGSTGSVGTKTFEIFKKDKKNFKVDLLSTYSNVSKIIKQAKILNVKNIIINNNDAYVRAKEKYKNSKIKLFNEFTIINKLYKSKEIHYAMVSVSGLAGLKPTIFLTKCTKNLAIVNKESLICGWDLIKKNLVKNNTNFVPIDSEHYSIFNLMKGYSNKDIEKIFITASGGPFLNYPKKYFKTIKPNNALKHPNWKMGKKITIDSATLMNKVFEVIEAKNLFNIPYKKILVLTHPNSYIHAVVKFKNGIIKFLIHEPDMKIPIYNSIYDNYKMKTKDINLKIINNPSLKKIDENKFPLIKLLKNLPSKNTLYETALISINDFFVYKFLENKINFKELMKLILKTSNLNEFTRFKKINPKKIEDIYNLSNYVSFKLSKLSI